MKPELSIVAVVIDNLEVTERFISSIKQYTTNYELILIDNGSKDKKAIDFVKKSAEVYFRFNKRTDLAKAWNKGISLCRGKYIAVVNNDTVVPPKWFEPLKETLDKNKKAGLVSPMTFMMIKGIYFKYKGLTNFDKTFSKPFKLVKFKDVVWGEFCVFKKEALKKVGGYSEIYKEASGEDLDICFKLYSKGYDIYVDPRVFVYHQGEATKVFEGEKRSKLWTKNFNLFKSQWKKYTRNW
ncbi:Glycosyl transferase family 2 [uncultured archaeon]|nr:Glycosyl transferase family 2 [uncultured archaeon]